MKTSSAISTRRGVVVDREPLYECEKEFKKAADVVLSSHDLLLVIIILQMRHHVLTYHLKYVKDNKECCRRCTGTLLRGLLSAIGASRRR